MQLEAAHSFIIQKLEEELPVYLGYDNTKHTEEAYRRAGGSMTIAISSSR
jgi:hypothetical protein